MECIWTEIYQPHSRGILLGTVYRPPDSSSFLNDEFMCFFEESLEAAIAEEIEVIIMGDLNCNFLPRTKSDGETKKIKIRSS